MTYAESLEQAIRITRRRSLQLAVAATVLGVAYVVGQYALLHGVYADLIAVALIVLAWVAYFRGSESTQQLSRLRGQVTEDWLPSPSHGLIALGKERLLTSGLSVPFDRYGRVRVGSTSYDEARHALTIDVMRASTENEGEASHRTTVALDPSVTKERAYAFAKIALERTQR